jgi:hypothetical protein
MAITPHVYCKNLDCTNAHRKQPIPLPYPNQPRTNQHPSVWPPAYFEANLACPECDQVSLYKKSDVHWLIPIQPGQYQSKSTQYNRGSWCLVSFDCGGQNCGIRVEFLVLTPDGESIDAISQKLPAGAYVGKCKKGHPYSDRGTGPYQTAPFPEFPGS